MQLFNLLSITSITKLTNMFLALLKAIELISDKKLVVVDKEQADLNSLFKFDLNSISKHITSPLIQKLLNMLNAIELVLDKKLIIVEKK